MIETRLYPRSFRNPIQYNILKAIYKSTQRKRFPLSHKVKKRKKQEEMSMQSCHYD